MSFQPQRTEKRRTQTAFSFLVKVYLYLFVSNFTLPLALDLMCIIFCFRFRKSIPEPFMCLPSTSTLPALAFSETGILRVRICSVAQGHFNAACGRISFQGCPQNLYFNTSRALTTTALPTVTPSRSTPPALDFTLKFFRSRKHFYIYAARTCSDSDRSVGSACKSRNIDLARTAVNGKIF